MTATLRNVQTHARFDVTDEQPIDSYLGPDATMAPYEAHAELHDRKLHQIVVFGWIVKNGKATRKPTAVTFTRMDLGLDPDDRPDEDKDFVPTVVPAWVAHLATAVVVAGSL
jgi:hypothetical protein